MNNKELFEALRMFEKEKDIPMDYMLQQIQKAIEIACKSYYGGNENVVFKADPDKNKISEDSPLGTAAIGKKVGDIINVEAPDGIIRFEVLEISKRDSDDE